MIQLAGECMALRIVRCTEDDIDRIVAIGKETYFDTFAGYCSKDIMEAYLAEAFERTKILSEVRNALSEFYFGYLDAVPVGYIKLNIGKAQSDLQEQNGLEIERIYVKKDYKGQGIGTQLIGFGIHRAIQEKMDFVWLGVWVRNSDAISFYRKNGFMEAGVHPFLMGDEVQTDFIMRRDVLTQ